MNNATVRLVAARELKAKLHDKTFIFSTLFFLLITIGSTVLPAVLGGNSASVAASDQAMVAVLDAAGLKVHRVADDAAAERLVRAGDVDAAVVAGPRVLAMKDAPSEVVTALSTRPAVQLLDPSAVDPFVAFIVPFAMAFVFFLTSFIFGLQIAQSVTEEKQTRVVEILVASVPIRALLAGKVLAMTLLAFGQILLITVVAFVGLRLGDVDSTVSGLIEPALGWFLPFFAVGFVMLATLWAGVGALVTRQEDLAGATIPLQLTTMVPLFAVLFLSDNVTAMTVLSYFPLTSPLAMPIRVFNGEASGGEPFLALALLAATAVGFLAVGARLYEGSLLRTNGRTPILTAWRSHRTG